MVTLVGPLATTIRELRQARKGATVSGTLGAEMWLAGVISSFKLRAIKTK